jgi:hypothetical protein
MLCNQTYHHRKARWERAFPVCHAKPQLSSNQLVFACSNARDTLPQPVVLQL